jgi:hypothetical protein
MEVFGRLKSSPALPQDTYIRYSPPHRQEGERLTVSGAQIFRKDEGNKVFVALGTRSPVTHSITNQRTFEKLRFLRSTDVGRN